MSRRLAFLDDEALFRCVLLGDGAGALVFREFIPVAAGSRVAVRSRVALDVIGQVEANDSRHVARFAESARSGDRARITDALGASARAIRRAVPPSRYFGVEAEEAAIIAASTDIVLGPGVTVIMPHEALDSPYLILVIPPAVPGRGVERWTEAIARSLTVT